MRTSFKKFDHGVVICAGNRVMAQVNCVMGQVFVTNVVVRANPFGGDGYGPLGLEECVSLN